MSPNLKQMCTVKARVVFCYFYSILVLLYGLNTLIMGIGDRETKPAVVYIYQIIDGVLCLILGWMLFCGIFANATDCIFIFIIVCLLMATVATGLFIYYLAEYINRCINFAISEIIYIGVAVIVRWLCLIATYVCYKKLERRQGVVAERGEAAEQSTSNSLDESGSVSYSVYSA